MSYKSHYKPVPSWMRGRAIRFYSVCAHCVDHFTHGYEYYLLTGYSLHAAACDVCGRVSDLAQVSFRPVEDA